MRQIILGLTMLGLAIHSIGAAHAATISFDDAFGPEPVPGEVTASLFKFDPALGTLTLVELSLDANTSAGSIAWDNEADIPTDVTLGIGAEVTATAPSALAAVAVPLQLGSALGIAADNDGAADFVGTDSFSVVGGIGNDTDSVSSGLAAVLLAYTATFAGETFNTDIDSLVQNFLSTTGGFGPIQQTPGVFDGTVEVIYTYNPIPEPSSAALAALGLLGLGWFGWRRRR